MSKCFNYFLQNFLMNYFYYCPLYLPNFQVGDQILQVQQFPGSLHLPFLLEYSLKFLLQSLHQALALFTTLSFACSLMKLSELAVPDDDPEVDFKSLKSKVPGNTPNTFFIQSAETRFFQVSPREEMKKHQRQPA